ncbi:sensor histidine kinase [Microbacterium sp. P03]|uniref:sensor histidine kinase n=1 Tax=Microbacterium sp. P03 TaxID=3366946 RepID=UPI003745AE83
MAFPGVAGMRAGDQPERAVEAVLDRTRERTASLNQLLFGAAVVVMSILVATTPFPGDAALFYAAVVLVFLITGATIVIPWNRLPLPLLAAVPVLDIVAITMMELASPDTGLGLLWIFPAIWLPASFGVVGLVGGLVLIVGIYISTIALTQDHEPDFSTYLLVPVIVAVSGSSFLTARRAAAQRMLLDKQARLLGHALERTRRQEQIVTEVLDAVDFGVIRIEKDGSISMANEAHDRLQQTLPQASEGGSPAFRQDGVTPVPAGGLPLERALRGEAFDGQIVWFGEPGADSRAMSVSARRLKDENGGEAGAVLISRDLTGELNALRARDELVASVSHELRTPLTAILGYIDLVIDDDRIPESARAKLEIAERNAERLLGIVADILAASSASQSSVELTITPDDIDIADVLRAAAESLQLRADERNVSFDLTGLEPAHAYADAQRLRQVIDNLISNGIKYNRDGGVVTIGCTVDGDSTWILVRDTGIGMTEEEAAGLFERFYRAESIRSSGVRGTGLGLAISRDIVRAHGGDITVRSYPQIGSTFVVRLPSTRAAAAPAPRVPPRDEEDAASTDEGVL